MSNVVTVITPVFNEEKYIHEAAKSLLNQKLDGLELELLLIDGMSTDRTREIITELSKADPRIRVLVNEKRKTPYAFNIGLREARGEYICIFGAHTVYDSNYIQICLDEIKKHNAIGVSGRVLALPAEVTMQAKCVAWAFGHPFGASGKSFRTQPEGFVDTVPYPVFKKQALLDLGGYDERLARNQDNDMNFRLRKAGHLLYCTWKTNAYYQSKKTISEILQYAMKTGRGNAVSLKVSPSSLSMRHHIPTLFVGSILFGVFFALVGLLTSNVWLEFFAGLLLLSIPVHLLVGTLVSITLLVKHRSIAAVIMPGIFFMFHFCYGFGTFYGWWKDKPDQWVEPYQQ